MPLNLGKYQQGDKKTQPEFPLGTSGVPTIAGPQPPTPLAHGAVEHQDPIHTVGANAIRK